MILGVCDLEREDYDHLKLWFANPNKAVLLLYWVFLLKYLLWCSVAGESRALVRILFGKDHHHLEYSRLRSTEHNSGKPHTPAILNKASKTLISKPPLASSSINHRQRAWLENAPLTETSSIGCAGQKCKGPHLWRQDELWEDECGCGASA